jgi:hypothetical protein
MAGIASRTLEYESNADEGSCRQPAKRQHDLDWLAA